MKDKFLAFIEENHLFHVDQQILLAVSGGMDSVVMADLFFKANVPFAIAHANFGLRGEESDADEAFVKKLAKKYKAACFTRIFATAAFAKDEKVSIQMAARALRYTWFYELMELQNIPFLATAHHQNDALETALLNFTKGTGISGLHGILPKSGNIIRPMLFATKEDIYDYLVARQLVWREDSSNESNKYQRNLLRNQVIPLLKEINPDIEHTFVNTLSRVKGAEKVFYRIVEEAVGYTVTNAGGHIYINLEKLEQLPEAGIVLAEILKKYHFNFSQAKQVWDRRDEGSGKYFDSPTHRINIDRGQFIISKKNLQQFHSLEVMQNLKAIEVGRVTLNFSTQVREKVAITNQKAVALLDLERLKFPLTIRKWKNGDWFIPLGMKKKKKLSDFMIDEKIPLNLKEEVFLLMSGDSVVWVIGHRIDDRFKITESTTQVYQAKLSSIL